MTVQHDDATREALQKLLQENGLSEATLLFRETVRDSLRPTDAAGVFSLDANAAPSESVIDVYGGGYLVQAEDIGPGLAFAASTMPDWQETMEMRTLRASTPGTHDAAVDKVEVEARLADILKQGGLLYPVESVTVEKAWYCTLPSGSIRVRVLP